MRKFIPLLLVFGLLIALVVWVNLAAKQHAPKQHTHAHQDDNSLIVVSPWEITSTDPSTTGFIYQRLQIAETLIDADNQGRLLPSLASSWHGLDGGKVWQFRLRQGVKFHDGTVLTAEHVVKSLNIALTKPTALEQAHIKQISAIDDQTVQFELAKPMQAFPAYLAHSTALILSPASFDDSGQVVKVIGTGAYQAVSIEPPQKVEQVAFADYWGKKASIEHITYLANTRSETRALLAQSQPNYLVYNLDAPSLARLTTDPNLQVATESIARTILYKVNAKRPPFDDVAFRQILSQAIDRQGIANTVLGTDQGVATQVLPPLFGDWQITTPTTAPMGTPDYPSLLTKLNQLGYQQNAQGQLLSKSSEPIRITLKTFSDRPELPIIATALQAQFAKLGIQVDVAVGNFSDIPASHQDGTLQMALYARNYGMIPNPLGALMEDFDADGSDWGAMNWHSPALLQKLEQLNQDISPAQATMLKQEIATILADELPVTPILYYQQHIAANHALQGVRLDALERNFYLNQLAW